MILEKKMEVIRGEIWMARLHKKKTDGKTSVQYGDRPIIITSNDAENKFSPVIKATPITSQLSKTKLPTHVLLGVDCGLQKTSVAMVEQTQTIDKIDLLYKIGDCTNNVMNKIDFALMVEYGLTHLLDYDLRQLQVC